MPSVTYQTKGHVALITIDRPQALNALNTQVLSDLSDAISGIDLQNIRCVIITGAGEKSFVAGADIAEMATLGVQGGADFSVHGNRVFRAIETLPVPVIAAVNGFALGGGCELALCCDIRICSDNASFAQPEVGLGITPGFGGTQRLSRAVGMGRAKQMIYTGERIKAPQALEFSLVNEVVPKEQLLERAYAIADSISANVPFAVRASKLAMNKGEDMPMDESLKVEVEQFSSCFATEDKREAMSAFLEKRKPTEFKNK